MLMFFLQKLNIQGESIELADSGNITASELSSRIPVESARYHLFSFNHNHEGDFIKSKGTLVFLMTVGLTSSYLYLY